MPLVNFLGDLPIYLDTPLLNLYQSAGQKCHWKEVRKIK